MNEPRQGFTNFFVVDLLHKWVETATERTETFEKKLLQLIFSVISVAKKTFARGPV